MSRTTYSFGDFTIDTANRRLTRNGQPVPLSAHQADILLCLVARPGEIVTKDALIEAAWRGIAVTDNSVEQAISGLRKWLGDPPSPRLRRASSAGQEQGLGPLIETVPRRGYRFSGDVSRADTRASDAELAAILEPHRALLEGRAALETLERDAVERAGRAFEAVVAQAPDYASGHLGLANACVLHFESTRADDQPAAEALARAAHHAREACRLEPESGDAWATLALVHHHSGAGVQAIAAARRAVRIEPDNWRHHLRLAYVGWGEERLRAAHRALAAFPGFPLAHLLAATVYVARQAFDLAEQELRAGAAAQDAHHGSAFRSVGSHWLLGLVRLARGDENEARSALQRELTFEAGGQLYARECVANTWYAIGTMDLRSGRSAEAQSAFREVLTRVPGHLLATLGLLLAERTGRPEGRPLRSGDAGEDAVRTDLLERRLREVDASGRHMDVAMTRAAWAVGTGSPQSAPVILEDALRSVHEARAGWLIPVDPLLNVWAHRPMFDQVLAGLRARAG